MPCGEVTITLQDVAMILGLPIAGCVVAVNPMKSQNEFVELYLGKTPPPLDRPCPGLRVSWVVRAEFNNCPEDADGETVKQHARCYEHFTNEFDLLTNDQVVWCPYREEEDRVKEMQLAPICTQDSNLWLTQAPLIYISIWWSGGLHT